MKNDSFAWDLNKNAINIRQHGVPFELAQEAFFDPKRIIAIDHKHSTPLERRFFCIGKVDQEIITVRFTCREGKIRIFGAGYWRRERKIYEAKNSIH